MQLYQPTITGSLLVSGSVITNGTITATTLVVQTVTSSVSYLTGSTQFGSLSSNTHTFTGSILASGSVGIGTNNPLALLHLSSSTSTAAYIHSTGTANYASINLTNKTTGYGYDVGFGGSTSIAPNCFYIYGGATASVKLAVASGGNVGIGTVYPSASLEVSGSAYVGGNTSNSNYQFFVKRGTDRSLGIGLQGGDLSLEFVNDAVTANVPTRLYANPLMVLGGNVGIGATSILNTTTNRTCVTVNGTSSSIISLGINNTLGAYFYSDASSSEVYSAAQLNLLAAGSGYIALYTGGTEKARLANDGSLLLGTTSSTSTRLQVAASAASWVSATFSGTGGTDKIVVGNLSGYGASIGGHNSALNAWALMYINPGGGAVYAGTQRIDNNSDQRIKENIQSIPNALDTVLSLKGRKFNMIDEDNILRYGFVAQEVQPHLSDFVTESTREYKNENIHIENLLTLETSGAAWSALLVEAIKQQQAQINELKALLNK